MIRQRRLFLVIILWLAQLFLYHPADARRILIWKILARTNRSILKSDWTGNLLTTTIDALIRAKTQQETLDSAGSGSRRRSRTSMMISEKAHLLASAVEQSNNRNNNHNNHNHFTSHRGGAVMAASHHHATTPNPNPTPINKFRSLILRATSRTPVLASPWTMGVAVGVVTVALILQRWHASSYPGVTLEDWELMCRDQLPEFWKTEVLPLLESGDGSSSTEHCAGRLAKKMIRKTRPLMKQRIQLAEQVSTILGSHLKTRKPLTSSEKDTLATYYAEITVEKLHSVTEGLRQKLDRANKDNDNDSMDQRKPSTSRYVGERSKIVQGLVRRIRRYMEGDAILLDETTLREYFKESLREAIVVVVPSDDNGKDELPLDSSSQHEQDLSTDEPMAEVYATTDTTPDDDSTILSDEGSDGQAPITLPSEDIDQEE